MTRRQFAALTLAPAVSNSQTRPSETSYASDHPDMLVRYLTTRLNALAARWDTERALIRSAEDVNRRSRLVRSKMLEMIHGLPRRGPLAPVVTGSFERPDYRVENVLFQSRPDFWVTGNLYIPKEGTRPFPGIISPCGHYADARMNPEYQSAYINMVKAGFVVLAYDPIGQGERRQYWNPETGATEVGGATTEHSMAGQVLLLLGEDLTHYRIWDGMRAIDYLESRNEVDKDRIGCAGHSGGGTLTQFIAALDERVKVAVINEGGTGHRWPIELRPESRLGPSDVEQNLFPAAVHGVDLCDIHAAIAPRPLLTLIENFNPRFNLAAEHILHRYQQLGVPDRFASEEATDPHAWTPKLRIATTRWFSKWFYGKPGPDTEPDFEVEPERRLYCTPNGSIHYSRKGDTIYGSIAKKAASIKKDGIANLAANIGYKRTETPLSVRHLVTTLRKGYRIEKEEFISEPGIYIPAWVFLPDKPGSDKLPLVYVHESGGQAHALEFGPIEKLVTEGKTVIAVDLRGIGETRPPHPPASDRPGEFGFLFDVETAMSYMAWYLDQSLLGMRVSDLTRAVDYAVERTGAAGVRMYGFGMGATWGLFAAALDDRIKTLTGERGLVSYHSLTQTDRYRHGANVFVRDLLLHGDLPDVAALLSGRELTLRNPVDPMKRVVSQAEAERTYESASAAFRRANRSEHFLIRCSQS